MAWKDPLKVRNIAVWETEPDKVLNSGGLGGVNEVLRLTLLLRLRLLGVVADSGNNSQN